MKNPTTVENLSQVPSGSVDTATLELLSKWKAEDATQDPDAIRTAERDVADFKKALNANRSESGESPLFS